MSFCPHFPKLDVQFFLEIRNPWGKVMERSDLRYENFLLIKGIKSPRKKVFFLANFAMIRRLYNKDQEVI